MSSLLVLVTTISKVRPHPNADRLDVAEVLGWQVVVQKGTLKDGDKVVYFPVDTVLPQDVSDRFNVTQYLTPVKEQKDGVSVPIGGRIRCAKLKGAGPIAEPSFGLAVPPDDPSWEVGANVAEHYRATKYEPPLPPLTGDDEVPNALFQAYTDIENMRNFPDLFQAGEEVVATEKIHGANCRAGLIEGELMCGSHTRRKKRPPDEDMRAHVYWLPMTIPGVKTLLEELGAAHKQVILYGETYGAKVQSLHYGREKDRAFSAFDLLADGRYLDYDAFKALCDKHGVPTCPVIYRGPFGLDAIKANAEGKTVVGGDHIREGLVVRPVKERMDPKVGRLVLKYLSEAYLFSKHADRDVKDV